MASQKKLTKGEKLIRKKNISRIALVIAVIGAGAIIGILGIRNSVLQDLIRGGCSMCYSSTSHRSAEFFSNLEEDTTQKGCLLVQRLNASASLCLQCRQDFYRVKTKCQRRVEDEPEIKDCFSYFSQKVSKSPILCDECSSGTPTKDLQSCERWPEIETQRPSRFKNCLIGARSWTGEEAFCSLCEKGYSYDPAIKRCIKSKVQGSQLEKSSIWKARKVLEGLKGEGKKKLTFSNKTVRSILSTESDSRKRERRLLTQQKPKIFTISATWDERKSPKISDQSLHSALKIEQQTSFSVSQYADFQGGLILFTKENQAYIKTSKIILEPAKRLKSRSLSSNFDYKLKCFYFQKICLRLETKRSNSGLQNLFLFPVSGDYPQGVIYTQTVVNNDHKISNFLPIQRSSYLILGFSCSYKRQKIGTRDALLRLDYLDTRKQFKYRIPNQKQDFSCLSLLYIEYSTYFITSFGGEKNGVLLYDLTQLMRLPFTTTNPDDSDHEHLIYLQLSSVIVMSTKRALKLYGYSIQGKTQYHFTVLSEVYGLAAYRESDFLLVSRREGELEASSQVVDIYDLRGVVYRYKLGFPGSGVIMSDYFGGPLFLNENLVLQFSYAERNKNPVCKKNTGFSFSVYGCRSCSNQGKIINKEFCELERSPLAIYRNYPLPELAINFKGQRFYNGDPKQARMFQISPNIPQTTNNNSSHFESQNDSSDAPPDRGLGTFFILLAIGTGVYILLGGVLELLGREHWKGDGQLIARSMYITSLPLIIGGFVYIYFFNRAAFLFKIFAVAVEFLGGLALCAYVFINFRKDKTAWKNFSFFAVYLVLLYLVAAAIFLFGQHFDFWIIVAVGIWQVVHLVLLFYVLQKNDKDGGRKRPWVLFSTLLFDTILPLLSLCPLIFFDVEEELTTFLVICALMLIISVIFLALAYQNKLAFYLGALVWAASKGSWWPVLVVRYSGEDNAGVLVLVLYGLGRAGLSIFPSSVLFFKSGDWELACPLSC